MDRSTLVRGLVVASLSLAALSSDARRADATETLLASASFESDSAGAKARPHAPPVVAENVREASSYFGGVSQVAAFGTSKRFRISDAGSTGEVMGIRLPFSSAASSGTLVLDAVATAEQEDADGGTLGAAGPEDQDWICGIAFGDDGKFRVHGGPTTVSYAANARYRFRITVRFEENENGVDRYLDYRVTECATSQVILESDDHLMSGPGTAASMTFRTDADGEGAFTVDELSATQ